MTINVGDKIPTMTLKTMVAGKPKDITSEEIFSGKRVVLFAVPGAFTPGCSMTHLPGYVVNADKIIAKGVDTIACIAVNDVFVMGAWGEAHNADHLLMLADGNGDLTRALGLEMDLTAHSLGFRSQRYAMIVENGTVRTLSIEPGPGISISAAESIMAAL